MSRLDDRARATLRRLVAAMLPAGADMPSGEAVDVHGAGFDRVLGLRGELAPAVLRGLALLNVPHPLAGLDSLAATDPEAHRALRLIILGAYYTHPLVQERIGYAGQPAVPVEADSAPDHSALLARVIARGPLW